MKKKIITVCGIGIACVAAVCVLLWNTKQPAKTVEAESVSEIIREMSDIVEEKIESNPKVKFSSNPYDYIEDNEAYDKLVQKGVSAVSEMLSYMETSGEDGLNDYLIAAAVEEILECSLKETDYAWEDADSFLNQWEKMLGNREKIVKDAMENGKTESEIIKELQPYGLVAMETIEKMQDDKTAGAKYQECAQKLESFVEITEDEKEILQSEVYPAAEK